MFKRICSVVVLALALASVSQMASAGTTNSTLTVSVNVQPSCTVSASPSLNFGTITAVSPANLDAQAPWTVNCASGTSWSATADLGLHSQGGYRIMVDQATDAIIYILATNSNNLNNLIQWGDGNNGTTIFPSTMGTGVPQPMTIYGRILNAPAYASQPGNYSDTVNVTITYQ